MSNQGGVYTFSKVAANNASADSTQNWSEGQAPSSLNDSARALLASIAKYRDDISGAIVTTGTAQNYIVNSNQVFDTLANFDGKVIAFTPHATNTGSPVTMSVDSIGANLPLRSAPNTELLKGVLIQGTPYVAIFRNADGALYLQGFYGNPYNVPLFSGMDYWGTIAPNSSFIFPAGQAISRTTYAAAFAQWSTNFGAGDGSTTFNVPDKTGRVSAMMESVGTRLNSTYFGNSTVLGAAGGSQSHALTSAEIPAVAFSGTTATENAAHSHNANQSSGSSPVQPGTGITVANPPSSQATSVETANHAHTFSGNISGGGGAHAIVQPTIICNYIIRIL